MPNQCEILTGRLLEVRADAGYRTIADVNAIFAAIGKAIARLQPQRAIFVVDWRRCPLMSDEASEHMLARMTGNNPLIERSAALGSKHSPVALLQFLRLVRDSGNKDRRLFDDVSELCAWLDEVLLPAERT